ncbi:MAG: hypothetical protein E7057_08865 [Lentisphaerae bacterium]|nr:hypothetical protein [Lentisphaerota bacterium]
MLAKFIRMRTARSHPRGARSACIERSTEGINQYREQSLSLSPICTNVPDLPPCGGGFPR